MFGLMQDRPLLIQQLIDHAATGKILKTRLREDFKDYKLPTA